MKTPTATKVATARMFKARLVGMVVGCRVDDFLGLQLKSGGVVLCCWEDLCVFVLCLLNFVVRKHEGAWEECQIGVSQRHTNLAYDHNKNNNNKIFFPSFPSLLPAFFGGFLLPPKSNPIQQM